ncbi:hypothetical protein IQ07DRAFT_667270, partial [Pyrenochaeta sp. DS3sAY3a]
ASNTAVLILYYHICTTGALQGSGVVPSSACVAVDNNESGPLLTLTALAVDSRVPTHCSPAPCSSLVRAALVFGITASAPDTALFRFQPRFFVPVAAPSTSVRDISSFFASLFSLFLCCLGIHHSAFRSLLLKVLPGHYPCYACHLLVSCSPSLAFVVNFS